MRALIVTLSSAPETTDPADLQTAFASLDALGIGFGRAVVNAMPSASVVNGYDFIVFPRLEAGFNGVIDTAAYTIPMFALFASAGAAGFGATPGVSGGAVGTGDKWVDTPWTNEAFIAMYTTYYTLTTGKALITVSATVPNEGFFTGGAQTNAGTVSAWRTSTAGGNYLYVSAADPNNHSMLPFLLVEAVKDGVLSAPPRRAPLSVDLDHINGAFSHADPGIIDKIASYVPAGGVIWGGITNGDTSLSAMSAAVQGKLRQYSGNKFKYCYHNHTGSDITSGGYDTVTEVVNKADQETSYLADKATMESYGLTFHQPAYYNSGSNAWSENTMELFTGDTSVTADGGDAAAQTGYGFKVFRCIRQSSRAAPQKHLLFHNQHAYKHTAHGILILATWDMANGNLNGGSALDMPYDNITDWRKNFQYVCLAISSGMTLYLHDEDFIAADQSPGIKQHGYVQMQIIADICNYCSAVVKGFADPINYIPDLSMSAA